MEVKIRHAGNNQAVPAVDNGKVLESIRYLRIDPLRNPLKADKKALFGDRNLGFGFAVENISFKNKCIFVHHNSFQAAINEKKS